MTKNISFNYNRKESNIDEPNTSITKGFNKISDIESVFNTLQTDRTDTQVWKIFLLIALLFLLLEMIIQKFVK